MTAHKTFTALGLTAAALGAGLATAAPASAGGIIVVASPSFENTCANGHSSGASGPTTHGPGGVSGLVGQIPLTSPLNHCGGADLIPTNELGTESKNPADVTIQDE